MFRTLIVSLMLAGGVALMAAPHAKAQSPDPALLAPGSSRAMLTPRPGIPHTGGRPEADDPYSRRSDVPQVRVGFPIPRQKITRHRANSAAGGHEFVGGPRGF
jgi:hypothetical protein